MANGMNSTEDPLKSECYTSLKAIAADFQELRRGTGHSVIAIPIEHQAAAPNEPLPKVRAATFAFATLERWEAEWRALWSPGLFIDRPALYIRDRDLIPPFHMGYIQLGVGQGDRGNSSFDWRFPPSEPGDELLAMQARLNHSISYRDSDRRSPGWIFRGYDLTEVVRSRVLRRLETGGQIDLVALFTYLNAALAAGTREMALEGQGPLHIQISRLKTLSELQFFVSRQMVQLMQGDAAAKSQRERSQSCISELFRLARAQQCEHELSSALEWAIGKALDSIGEAP